jgi:hypothetical protein
MSAIASFIKMSRSVLGGLRSAAVPKKRLFSAAKDTYYDYLRQHGSEIADYQWSGFVLATLLPYLEEKHQIDLMKSEYSELAKYLTSARNATCFILTFSQRTAFLNRLDPRLFSEDDMRRYFNEFNATNEQEIGRAMLDGVAAFQKSLSQLDEASVVVFSIV